MLEGEVEKESEAIMQNVARLVLNDVIGTGHWMAVHGMVKTEGKAGESWRESRQSVFTIFKEISQPLRNLHEYWTPIMTTFGDQQEVE